MVPMDLVIAGLAGLVAALSALWWFSRAGQLESPEVIASPKDISFLFDQDRLVDTTAAGEKLLDDDGSSKSFNDVLSVLGSRFDCTPINTSSPSPGAETICLPIDPKDPARLILSHNDQTRRIDLAFQDELDGPAAQETCVVQSELEMLRRANEATPCPIWQTDETGKVTWFNFAYGQLYAQVFGGQPEPDKPLFDLSDAPNLPTRMSIQQNANPHPFWYNVTETRQPDGSFYVATDSNAVVHAELAQRNFVQTLAKTFAHLSIGLAIFNDERQLILFNPALVDLTELNAEFLSSRPYLLSFFDELRNKRTMPEPKNYNSWRQQIADLVAAATDGRYSEIWSLENGRTYRVNGRPHPDGAIAFLIEDISAEVSLTRRFRAELELGQSVIDSLDSALVVFSSSGILTISNTKYAEMWQVDPDRTFADITIIDAMRDWQHHSAPSPIWGELRDFVLDFQDRTSWFAQVPGPDGRLLDCDVAPLSSGATMVRFKETDKVDNPVDSDASA